MTRSYVKATIPRFCGKCRTIGLFSHATKAQQYYCKACNSSVGQQWYVENRAHVLARMKAVRSRLPHKPPRSKATRLVIEGRVRCPDCCQMVPVEDYYSNAFVRCGVSSYCITCLKRKYRARKLKEANARPL